MTHFFSITVLLKSEHEECAALYPPRLHFCFSTLFLESSPGAFGQSWDLISALSFCFPLAGGAKKCIKVGGEFYSSSTLEETTSGHVTQTGQSHSYQQGETHPRVMDVRSAFFNPLRSANNACAFISTPYTFPQAVSQPCVPSHRSISVPKYNSIHYPRLETGDR